MISNNDTSGHELEYEIPFGPAHPGPGNFSIKLRLDGERIISAKSDPGYLHRGFEKLMEYRMPMQNAVLSDRICVFEPLSWNLVHAEAVDELMGINVPKRAKYIRVTMAELSRIQSHIIWYGVMSKAIGFETGFMLAFGYRDYILDLFEQITGGRVYPTGYICPGGVRRDLTQGIATKIRTTLRKMNKMLSTFEKFDNISISARTKGIGVLPLKEAIRLGATGPVLRASGLKTDVRKDDPYEAYPEFDFDIPVRKEGDSCARLSILKEEIEESMKIIKQALDNMPEGNFRVPSPNPKIRVTLPKGEVYVRNECARGEGSMYMVSVGGEKPYRCKIRGPSFLHMIPVLEYLLKDSQIADIPAIYWSLNVCPADLDR